MRGLQVMALLPRVTQIGFHLILASLRICWVAVASPRNRRGERVATELSRLVERLGGAYLKLGQLLATRVDLVGATVSRALGRLHDQVRPMRAREARAAARQAFGEVPWFLEGPLARHPVASGSVACVYRARAGQRTLAMKVRRPGVTRAIITDLAILRAIARLGELLPMFRRVPILEIVEQLGETLVAQLDFAREADNLRQLRRDLSRVCGVVVPAVIDEWCRPGVVAMEFLPGLDRSSADRLAEATLRSEVETLVRAVYRMLFVEGFIHVDLHQGNTYFRTDGTVAVVDAGFVFRMSDVARRKFTEFFAGMIRGDGETCADILLSTTRGVWSDVDLEGFRQDVIRLVVETAGMAVGEFSLVSFSIELFDLQRRRGLFAEPEFIFPLLCLLSLEGTVKQYHPLMDFQLEAAPHVMHGLLAPHVA